MSCWKARLKTIYTMLTADDKKSLVETLRNETDLQAYEIALIVGDCQSEDDVEAWLTRDDDERANILCEMWECQPACIRCLPDPVKEIAL